MFWKKNALSYVFWVLYSLVWGSMVVFLALNHIMPLPILEALALPLKMIVAIVPVLMIPVIGILVRRYIIRHFIHEDYDQTFWKITEGLVVVVIMAIGIWLRYDSLWDKDIQVGAYMQAMVTEGGTISYLSHGATNLYMQLLRGLFLLFGNKPALALWLQVILFYIAGLFLYQGLKRVVGKLPALGVFAFFILCPFFRTLSMELSPLGFYLALYCFCLFYLTEVLRDIHGKPLQYFFGGVQVAACIYLDFIGVTLIIWAILLLLMHNLQTALVEKWRLCLVTFGAGLLAGEVVLVVTDLLFTQRSVMQVLMTWWMQYVPEGFVFRLDAFNDTPGILQVVILIMGLLGIFSFWFRKKTDRFCPMVLLLAVVALLGCFGMSSDEMGYEAWIVLQLLLVAWIGCLDVFDMTDRAYLLMHQPPVPVLEAYETEQTEEKLEFISESQEATVEEIAESIEEASGEIEKILLEVEEIPVEVEEPIAPKPIKLLENPLPLPKRHARRTLDYPITDIPEEDDFDIQITEDDDYDYKF